MGLWRYATLFFFEGRSPFRSVEEVESDPFYGICSIHSEPIEHCLLAAFTLDSTNDLDILVAFNQLLEYVQ